MHSKREEAFCAGNGKKLHTHTYFSGPLLEDAFKEGKGIQGGKRHSRREEAFWEGDDKKVHTKIHMLLSWFKIRFYTFRLL